MSVGSSNLEVEIKLRAPDPQAAAELLTTHGFSVSKPRVYERNAIFDNASGELRIAGKLLRVREVGQTGTLTFKGRATPGLHKSREELEVSLLDPHTFEAILKRLGYERTFVYEKFRTEFEDETGKGTATLDETPIGTFLELEGEAKWIDGSASRLGFQQSDYITSSYGALYLDWCTQRRVKPLNMVWEDSSRPL